MEWLFGKRLTPEEMLRRNQRSLNKAIRDLDRERMKMEQQEKKIIMDIKKMAKDNQMVKLLLNCYQASIYKPYTFLVCVNVILKIIIDLI